MPKQTIQPTETFNEVLGYLDVVIPFLKIIFQTECHQYWKSTLFYNRLLMNRYKNNCIVIVTKYSESSNYH